MLYALNLLRTFLLVAQATEANHVDDIRVIITPQAREIKQLDPLFIRAEVTNKGTTAALIPLQLCDSNELTYEITDAAGKIDRWRGKYNPIVKEAFGSGGIELRPDVTAIEYGLLFLNTPGAKANVGAFPTSGRFSVAVKLKIGKKEYTSNSLDIKVVKRDPEEMKYILETIERLWTVVDASSSSHRPFAKIDVQGLVDDDRLTGELKKTIRWVLAVENHWKAPAGLAAAKRMTELEKIIAESDEITADIIRMCVVHQFCERRQLKEAMEAMKKVKHPGMDIEHLLQSVKDKEIKAQ